MRWWHWVLISTVACLAGFIAGRRSVPRPGTVSVSDNRTADGGVPEARATATVEKGTTTLSYSCKVEPPVIKYVKVPVPGKAPVECPQLECPVVSCSGTATSETPQASAQTVQPQLPPTVVTVRETAPRHTWGIGPSGLCTSQGCGFGAAGKWAPLPWLELHAAGTTAGAEADVLATW